MIASCAKGKQSEHRIELLGESINLISIGKNPTYELHTLVIISLSQEGHHDCVWIASLGNHDRFD